MAEFTIPAGGQGDYQVWAAVPGLPVSLVTIVVARSDGTELKRVHWTPDPGVRLPELLAEQPAVTDVVRDVPAGAVIRTDRPQRAARLIVWRVRGADLTRVFDTDPHTAPLTNGAPRPLAAQTIFSAPRVPDVADDPIRPGDPDPARRYNYWLGGKDHFAADRASGDAVAARYPGIITTARENRAWLERAVSCLAVEHRVRQFLDVGAGIPVDPYVHEIAQRTHPGARVVYVDHNPVVESHCQALMAAVPPARTGFIHADLRNPDAILADPVLTTVLDLDEPVGLLLSAVLHFLADVDDPAGVVARLLTALPGGSYVAVSHATYDLLPDDTVERLRELGDDTVRPRTHAEITQIVDGLTLIDPGLVPLVQWRPDLRPVPQVAAPEAAMYAVAARLP